MQELLAKSYLAADRDRCYAVLLQFHETAFKTLGHTIPLEQNTLSELHAAVIRRLTVQQPIFPQAFAASTIRHEMHLLHRARRYEIIKQLQLPQKPSDRDILLQNLKTIQLLNIGKKGYRFPEKHIWLIENSERYYNMWKKHFSSCRLHDSRVSRKPTFHNIGSQYWNFIVESKESIRVVDQETGKFISLLLY